uniref:RanBP2-type domain-containing protein n=2 Tax=Lotharella globosa TaxID=91324 RepID=A0A7S3YL90_9EUKA
MMNLRRLNQSEISKIVNVPQPYISMFLNRRWRGSFDSPTWIRLVEAVSKWLKKEKQNESASVHKEQLSPSSSPLRKDPARKDPARKDPTRKDPTRKDPTESQTKSPERKPERYDLPPPLRSSLLPSFIRSGGDSLRPFNWRCSVCTYMNHGASIECKICGKLKRRH